MATEAGSSRSARPRPALLVLLGVAVVAFMLMRFGGSSGPEPAAVGSPDAVQPRQGEIQAIDPSALDVKLEALARERTGPGEAERDPFRFRPKAAPPPPVAPQPTGREDAGPVGPPPPPPPPPITVKFIGTMELPQGGLVAIFMDCTVGRRSVTVREGGTILGQYRLVKIGLQTVIVEHLDGRGRTTLPKTGQECVK